MIICRITDIFGVVADRRGEHGDKKIIEDRSYREVVVDFTIFMIDVVKCKVVSQAAVDV